MNQSRIAQLENEKQLTVSESVTKGQDEERGRIAKTRTMVGGFFIRHKFFFNEYEIKERKL
ncbi:MAG: hypothetical protein U5K54_09480 [Cytophagales bacterium]|nr:hypothetical protein [Cytophagales bacterium]